MRQHSGVCTPQRTSDIKLNHAQDLDKLKYLSVKQESELDDSKLTKELQEKMEVNYHNVLP